MTRKTLILLAVLVLSTVAGRWANRSPVGAAAFVDVIVDPSQLAAACRSTATINEVSVVDSGVTFETFLVRWTSGIACQTAVAVKVTATFRDGSIGSKTEFVNGSAGQALVKVFGSRGDSRAVRTNVTVIVNGTQAGTNTNVVAF